MPKVARNPPLTLPKLPFQVPPAKPVMVGAARAPITGREADENERE